MKVIMYQPNLPLANVFPRLAMLLQLPSLAKVLPRSQCDDDDDDDDDDEQAELNECNRFCICRGCLRELWGRIGWGTSANPSKQRSSGPSTSVGQTHMQLSCSRILSKT
jgi:hypothetical protein